MVCAQVFATTAVYIWTVSQLGSQTESFFIEAAPQPGAVMGAVICVSRPRHALNLITIAVVISKYHDVKI